MQLDLLTVIIVMLKHLNQPTDPCRLYQKGGWTWQCNDADPLLVNTSHFIRNSSLPYTQNFNISGLR